MKQLTIEQKAEDYDKAIKVIKDNLDALNEIIETGVEIVNIQAIKNCFYKAFPELKENKQQDKTVLEAIKEEKVDNQNCAKSIDYENATIVQQDFTSKEEVEPKILGIGVEHVNGTLKECIDKVISNYKEEKESTCHKCKKEQLSHSCQDVIALERCVIEHEKPADKVKPKFKIGDWITNRNYTCKIVKVKLLNYYILQSQDNDIIYEYVSYVDKHFHLWTIEDAKDGDIIYIKRHKINDEWLLMVKEIDNDKCNRYIYDYYAFCITTDNVYYDFIGCWGVLFNSDIVLPATKEQRDLLFTKMKEAGYEWDTEKKELKKIEEKSST